MQASPNMETVNGLINAMTLATTQSVLGLQGRHKPFINPYYLRNL